VARLAGIMQFLARAEPLLGCDRQLVVPLINEAGLGSSMVARLRGCKESIIKAKASSVHSIRKFPIMR